MPRPTGGYVEQMLDPGGWPDSDEDVFYDRSADFSRVLREVTDVLETCRRQRMQVFDGGVWSGTAAGAADAEFVGRIEQLVALQNDIAGVITWHQHIANSIVDTKLAIVDNVELGHRQIEVLQNDPALDAAERTTAINAVLLTAHGANVGIMAATAEGILATRSWTPPRDALPDLLDRLVPPVADIADPQESPTPPADPSASPDTTPTDGPDPAPDGEDDAAPATPPVPTIPATPGRPDGTDPSAAPDEGAPHPPADAPAAPGVPPTPGVTPQVPTGGSAVKPPAGTPAASAKPAPHAVDDTSVAAVTPAVPGAQAGPATAGAGKGLAPASAGGSVPVAAPTGLRDDTSAPAAPAAAGPGAGAGVPGGLVPPAAGRGAARSGGGSGGVTPAGQRPMGAHPYSRASTPSNRATPQKGPAGRPDTKDHSATDISAAVTAVPVSAARAERDAIAAASAADAEGRGGSGADPLRLARRIAAALNAPGGDGENDFGFFWVTAVTTDATIVVANSYGIAYIPDGVRLPEPVRMASADDLVPAPERARWATHPVQAVQGWASHHGKALRAVIATQTQFGSSDPGTAKILLTPDDIPQSGEIAGRRRLEVVDPNAAQRLSETDGSSLTGLLPPAPAGPAGTEDRRLRLWFDVMKPMASKATGREAAHLRAFRVYAVHARDLALAQAHSAVDVDIQRHNIADWLYWSHLTALLDSEG